MEEKDTCISEEISGFLRLLDDAQKDYAWAMEEETRLERLTQDYLHLIELTDLSYHERAKLAAKLKDCRVQRRSAKDMVAILEPLTEFLTSERGKVLINQLQQVLGKIRKAEKHIECRTYTPKVLSREKFERGTLNDQTAGIHPII